MVSLQLKLHFCAKFRKYRVKHYGSYAVHNVFICCTAAHSWPSEEVFCAVCFVYCLLIIPTPSTTLAARDIRRPLYSFSPTSSSSTTSDLYSQWHQKHGPHKANENIALSTKVWATTLLANARESRKRMMPTNVAIFATTRDTP